MRRNLAAFGFLTIATAATAAVPQSSDAKQADPKPPPAADATANVAAARAARIAAQQAQLEAQSKAIAAFGHLDEFAAALAKIHDEVAAPHEEPGATDVKWWTPKTPFHDLRVPMSSVESWLGWNRPDKSRTMALAVDFETDGHPFAAIVDLSKQLTSKGVEFLLVTFPTRVEVYPELVLPGLDTSADPDPKRPPFAGMAPANTQFLIELCKAGVEVLDLTPAFVAQRFDASDPKRELLYHRCNMHWTPRAAELAAETIAKRLAQLPSWKPGPYKEGRQFTIRPRDMAFLARGNGEAPDAAPEPILWNRVAMNGPPIPEQAKDEGPVVLLGDSFTSYHKDFDASLAQQLLRFTGYPIDVLAPPGGGALACRQQLKRQGTVESKKVVVWVMQEAVLAPSSQFRKLAVVERQ
jgi:hypothetical protein